MSKELINKVRRIMESDLGEENLNEMAKISGELETAIKKVITDKPELSGLELKKAIKADTDVKAALGDQELFDNQLNKFIALQKGERTLGQRGRKPLDKETDKSTFPKPTSDTGAGDIKEEEDLDEYNELVGGEGAEQGMTASDALKDEEDKPEELCESFKRMKKLAGLKVIKG